MKRTEWDGFTLIEMSPAEEDQDWVDWTGGHQFRVFDATGRSVYRASAPYSFSIEPVTADASEHLVVRQYAAGMSGCCDGITVLAPQAGELEILYSVGAFGRVELVDIDGDGDMEVVGDTKLWSDVLPSIDRAQVPFVCKWDGRGLVDVSSGGGVGVVRNWIAERRVDLLAYASEGAVQWAGHAARALVASTIHFGRAAAVDEISWIEQELGSDFVRDLDLKLEDYVLNMATLQPCR